MAIFNNMSITNKGQALYAKAQAGTQLNFTKLMVGSGDIGTQNPASLTALITPKFDVGIQSITPNTELKTATISGMLSNSAITIATYVCEIGLFATDPDEGEILYAYGSAGNYGDYMAPASSGPYSWNYQINAAIGNAANVTVTLSQLSYDSGIVNTSTTLLYVKGGNQKEVNKSIDNIFKLYPTTNVGNVYSATVSNITTLVDGYPLAIKFNAASTGAISLKINALVAKSIVDYYGNPVTNVRTNLIANLRYEATSGTFILLGKGGGGNATSNQLVKDATATVNSGPIVGTLDLTNLVTGNIKSGITINGIQGKTSVVDTADATALAAQIVAGYTGYVNGSKVTGNALNVKHSTGVCDASYVTFTNTGSNGMYNSWGYDVYVTNPFPSGTVIAGKFKATISITPWVGASNGAIVNINPTISNFGLLGGSVWDASNKWVVYSPRSGTSDSHTTLGIVNIISAVIEWEAYYM